MQDYISLKGNRYKMMEQIIMDEMDKQGKGDDFPQTGMVPNLALSATRQLNWMENKGYKDLMLMALDEALFMMADKGNGKVSRVEKWVTGMVPGTTVRAARRTAYFESAQTLFLSDELLNKAYELYNLRPDLAEHIISLAAAYEMPPESNG